MTGRSFIYMVPLAWMPAVGRGVVSAALAFTTIGSWGCRSQAEVADVPGTVSADPVYNTQTGRLEQLRADRDGDGRKDTVAHMDGARLKHIEIDRDGDGQPDRWEYYEPAAPGRGGSKGIDPRAVIVRADEVSRPDGPVTRREFYDAGLIQRVEEDTNLDGGVDKWEYYRATTLVRVDLDLEGRGRPDRRLVYASDGTVERIEEDADGDGTFHPVSPAR